MISLRCCVSWLRHCLYSTMGSVCSRWLGMCLTNTSLRQSITDMDKERPLESLSSGTNSNALLPPTRQNWYVSRYAQVIDS